MSLLEKRNIKALLILAACIVGGSGVSHAQTAREKSNRCFEQALVLGKEYDRLGTEEARQKSAAKVTECERLSEIALDEERNASQKQLQNLENAVNSAKRAVDERLKKDGVAAANGTGGGSGSFKTTSSGNGYPPSWVSDCVEHRANGVVRCDRYGGFAREYGNLPAACEANNGVACRMTFCELSTYVPIFSSTRPYVFDKRIRACSSNGVVNGRRQFYGFN
jgi:hypothetical protein